MYFLLKMGIFQPAMFDYRSVHSESSNVHEKKGIKQNQTPSLTGGMLGSPTLWWFDSEREGWKVAPLQQHCDTYLKLYVRFRWCMVDIPVDNIFVLWYINSQQNFWMNRVVYGVVFENWSEEELRRPTKPSWPIGDPPKPILQKIHVQMTEGISLSQGFNYCLSLLGYLLSCLSHRSCMLERCVCMFLKVYRQDPQIPTDTQFVSFWSRGRPSPMRNWTSLYDEDPLWWKHVKIIPCCWTNS